MSKIALTPNASGTGTFTIAAPNSNTDRTLTLPDEAGTVLTSLSSLLSSNLSGALPSLDGSSLTNLSAVDSTGSNANGYYIKLKGGALICWHIINFSTCTNSTFGNWYASSPSTWTYPVAFSASPAVTTTSWGGNYNHIAGKVLSAGTSTATIYSTNPTSNPYDQQIMVIAIGTWS